MKLLPVCSFPVKLFAELGIVDQWSTVQSDFSDFKERRDGLVKKSGMSKLHSKYIAYWKDEKEYQNARKAIDE